MKYEYDKNSNAVGGGCSVTGKTRLFRAFFILLFTVLLFLAGLFSLQTQRTEKAGALKSSASGVVVGGGADLWNASSSTVNDTVLGDLATKLFDDGVAVDYIKSNDTEYATTGNYVVPASIINANPRVNSQNGLVVKLGNMDWMVTSLTLAGSSNDQVIATLMLADAYKTQSIYYTAPNTDKTKGNNMYSSSTLRSNLLSWADFKLFSDGTAGGFASKYLVQPSQINYQKVERPSGRSPVFANGNNFPNDAYGAISSGWNSAINYQPGFTFKGVTYEAWSNDYIWIPSATEVGWADYMTNTSIWRLSNSQRQFSAQTYQWFRSGHPTYYEYGVLLEASTGKYYSSAKNSLNVANGVRPAIHLNLTAMGQKRMLKSPADVTPPVVYNGNNQGVATLATKPSWYITDVYGDPSKVTVTYDSAPKDAGNYTGTVALGLGCAWQDGTTDPKTFSFEITQKPVGLTLGTDTSTGLPTATVKTADLCGSDAPPNIIFRYTGNGYNSTTPPTTVGTYTATAEISDTNSNYKLDNTYTQPVTVTARKVAVPVVVGSANLTYDGTEQTLTLQNAGADVNIVCPTTGGITFADGKLKVTDAGTYTVRATLKDTVNTVWSDATGGTGSREITVRVAKKTLNLSLGITDNSWTWTIEDTPTVTATDDRVSGDNVEVILSYQQSGGSKIQLTSDSSGSISATFPKLERGNYELIAELGTSGASGNYDLRYTPNPRTFRVTGTNASVTDVKWQYTNGDDPTIISATGDAIDVTYNGEPYKMSIDDSGLAEQGVQVKAGSYVNAEKTDAGTYTVSVTLEKANENIEFEDTVFTLVLTIAKAKYDLSGVNWGNTSLVYSGSNQTVDLAGLPAGLVARLGGNREMNAGDYTAQILSFTVLDGQNYVTPTQADPDSYTGAFTDWTKDWEIAQKEIVMDWTSVPTTDAQNQIYPIPVLQADSDKVEYKYYKSNASGDQVEEIAIADLVMNQSQIEYYLVEAIVKSNFAQNYKAGTGDNPYLFLVGDNKTLVRIEVNVKDEGATLGGQLPYRAGGYEAELSVTEGALTAEDFEITYCDRGGSPLGGIPSELGEYAVHVNLKADKAADFYLQEMIFNYEIVAAVIDLSDLVWGYTDAESGEDTEYTEGFIYARKDGEALTHTVKLINVPEELAAFIEYDGTVEESKVGNYVAKFRISSDFDSQHYETLVFPSAMGEVTSGAGELKWRIKALEIGRPMQGSIVFDGDGHDVVKLSGIALDDWAEYLNVTVKYVEPDSITGVGVEFAGTDAVNAGRYLVTFEFKSELLGGALWDSGNTMQQTVSVTVEKLKLTMTGWDAKLPPNPMFTTEPESKYYKRIIRDMDGNEVDITAIRYNTTYRAEILVAEEYGDNVELEFADGVENVCEFTTDPDPNLDPPREIVKPTFEQDSLVYNGEDQTFVLKWTTAGDERYFEIAGELTQTNAGDYEVRIRFIDGANARWSDGTASELVLSFSITKAIIAEEWNEYDRETNAYPTLKDARIAGLVTYEYFDLEGNPIAESELENGTKYRVRARLTDEAYENYAFGEELLQESGEHEFETRSLSPFQSLSALLGLPVDFPLWQVAVTVVSLILIIVFLILWIKYGKQKKEAKETIEQYEDLNGNLS